MRDDSLKALEKFGAVMEPEEALEPILSKEMGGVFLSWLTEIWAEDELTEVGIKPRKRAIFGGLPGTGKTTLAHHLSARLGMRMLLVGPEKINQQYVGASAGAVGRLFDAVQAHQEPIVLFFDEFDSAASKRMGSGLNEVGEQDHNLMINTLLSRMDRYDGIVIGASNFEGRLDEALWRRFDLHVTLPLPGKRECERILERYMAPFVLSVSEISSLADSFETGSPALMRQFCENLKRQIIVGPLTGWDMSKNATITRILEGTKPHPEVGTPKLWSHKTDDLAIQNLHWPLSREARPSEVANDSAVVVDATENVVSLADVRKGLEE